MHLDAHAGTNVVHALVRLPLHRHGADVNAKTNIGLSVLFYVEVDGVESKKIIQYLKEHGAKELEQ